MKLTPTQKNALLWLWGAHQGDTWIRGPGGAVSSPDLFYRVGYRHALQACGWTEQDVWCDCFETPTLQLHASTLRCLVDKGLVERLGYHAAFAPDRLRLTTTGVLYALGWGSPYGESNPYRQEAAALRERKQREYRLRALVGRVRDYHTRHMRVFVETADEGVVVRILTCGDGMLSVATAAERLADITRLGFYKVSGRQVGAGVYRRYEYTGGIKQIWRFA